MKKVVLGNTGIEFTGFKNEPLNRSEKEELEHTNESQFFLIKKLYKK